MTRKQSRRRQRQLEHELFGPEPPTPRTRRPRTPGVLMEPPPEPDPSWRDPLTGRTREEEEFVRRVLKVEYARLARKYGL